MKNEPVWRHTFGPAMSWYQVASPAVASEEEHSCNHQNAPQEGANAADQHWVLKHSQDLRQIPSLALRLRRNGHLWVWKANTKQMKSNINPQKLSSWVFIFYILIFIFPHLFFECQLFLLHYRFDAQHGTRLPIFITLLTHTVSTLLVSARNHYVFFFPFLLYVST